MPALTGSNTAGIALFCSGRVVRHATLFLVDFAAGAKPDHILPYADTIISKGVVLLQSNDFQVRGRLYDVWCRVHAPIAACVFNHVR